MSIAPLIFRLLLAAVFLVAGLAKLADRAGSREAVEGFGVPDRLAGVTAALLPILELAAAALLIPSATARAGALLTAVLLIVFCAAITRSLVRGEAPDCHCFGQLHSSPAGPKTLIRNVLLLAVAIFVVVEGPGLSATAWVARLSGVGVVALVGGVVLVALFVAFGLFALSLLRQHGQLLLRIDRLEETLASHGIAVPEADAADPVDLGPIRGLPNGTPAPDFQLLDLRHRKVSLDALTDGSRPLMLLFTDPGCGPCSALMPRVGEWQREYSDKLRIALISRGERDANLAHAREHGLEDVLLQHDREVSERYEVGGTPSAVLIGTDGTIASPLFEGADAIATLVSSQIDAPSLELHHHHPAVDAAVGQPAPDLTLRTLDGEERLLSSVLDGPTTILFWRPSCGYCDRMLPDVRAFEAARPEGSPNLVLISTDDAETNREMGLDAPILLDDSFAAGQAFGVSGTPSAVLVDGDGLIASGVAVGAPAVLALMGADGAVPVG